MHRQPLLDWLSRYETLHPDEIACVDGIRALVLSHDDCFERSCWPGHITASVWIASSDRRRFLLTHHRKLDRWLQLGGHVDGDPDVQAAALREAREESGMRDFEFRAVHAELPLIDVDIHAIPALGDEPAHEHHDLRFVLVAAAGQVVQVSDESHALQWFDTDSLEALVDEPSLLRLGRKARQLLG